MAWFENAIICQNADDITSSIDPDKTVSLGTML